MRKVVIFVLLLSGLCAYGQNLSCRFVQTVSSNMVQGSLVSEGMMWFCPPDKVRWEYTSPVSNAFVMNGDEAFLVSEGDVRKLETGNGGVFKGIADIMMAGVSGSGEDRFEVERDGDRMTLVPKRRDMKKLFARVVLVFRDDGLPLSVLIEGQNGDTTHIAFSGHDTAPIPEEVFNTVR
ncbi:MAG: outer membrane lipoprotein carrier protein LolA [Candidatus Cryptobacteroides sp.]